jgi:uncharacterized membrane protein YedE/YeeE
MTQDQLAQLHWMVLAATGLVSAFFGAIMHRTHFCTMGAVSDAVLMGSFTRLRQWALAVAVASLGFGALTLAGLISPLQSIYAVPHVYWFSSIAGGLGFGWGMVLASGCGAKSLVRLAGGNLKSLMVLVVMGLSALMTLKGVLAFPRVYVFETLTWDPQHGVFLGQWFSHFFNIDLTNGVFAASLMMALLLLTWILQDRSFLSAGNLSTGISVGLIIVCVWAISGVMGHGLEHPDTLEEFYVATFSRKMEAISLTAPVAMGLDALLYFSDGTKRLTLGMASVIGILAGAWLSACLNGSLRLESFVNVKDFLRHLWGGCLMGFGAVLAMGCSIGQGLSGLSTANLPSLMATCAMLLGAYLALIRDLHKAN